MITRIGRLDKYKRSNFRAVGRNVGDTSMCFAGQLDRSAGRYRKPSISRAIQIVLQDIERTMDCLGASERESIAAAVALCRKHGFDGIVSLRQSLAQSLGQLDLVSIQHASQITSSRRDNNDLRGEWFWTADQPVYYLCDHGPVLYLARGKHNLVFSDGDLAISELLTSRDYSVELGRLGSLIQDPSTLMIEYGDLSMNTFNHELSYVSIGLDDLGNLNKTEYSIIKRILGVRDFEANREFMLENGVTEIEFHVLNSKYLEKKASEDTCLARVCRLGMMSENSVFKAIGRGVDSPYVSTRGRLRYPQSSINVAYGEVEAALAVLSKDPMQTARHLNDHLLNPILKLC